LHLILVIKFVGKRKFHRASFEILVFKVKIKGVLAGYSVAMVTYSVMITTCQPMIGQSFDTMIVAAIDNEL